jgi:hypothetical protein
VVIHNIRESCNKTPAGDEKGDEEISFDLGTECHVTFDRYRVWQPLRWVLFTSMFDDGLYILSPNVLRKVAINKRDEYDIATVACTFVNNVLAYVDRPLCTVLIIFLQCYFVMGVGNPSEMLDTGVCLMLTPKNLQSIHNFETNDSAPLSLSKVGFSGKHNQFQNPEVTFE